MVALTFPDGARRDFPNGATGLDIAKGNLAFPRQAHGRHGARWRARGFERPHRARRQDRIRQPRGPARAGADPARRRPCAGGGRAEPVAGHAGHHRTGDRETASTTTSSATSRSRRRTSTPSRRRCARSSRATNPSPRRRGRATKPSACSATRASCSRSSWSTPSRRTSRSRSTSRATGSTSAAART